MTPEQAVERAGELLESAAGFCSDEEKQDALRQLEDLARAFPDHPPVLEIVARAQVAVTEECTGPEAELAVAALRRLVLRHPDLDELRRQLCYALFNRYCDEGLSTYLGELHRHAAELPDRDELEAMADCKGLPSDGDL